MQRVSIGSDHGGYGLKETVKKILQSKGYDVLDVGTFSEESCDYSDFAFQVTDNVVSGTSEKGILICKSGIGMSMAANRVHGIRGALCYQPEAARLSRAHNDANVLVLSSLFTKSEELQGIIEAFFETEFEQGRHIRRINKLDQK